MHFHKESPLRQPPKSTLAYFIPVLLFSHPQAFGTGLHGVLICDYDGAVVRLQYLG